MKKSEKTGLIFKEAFTSPKKEEVYKTFMNDFSDPTLENFSPISMSVANKPYLRKRGSTAEWVDSYKEAAKILAFTNKERRTGKRIEHNVQKQSPIFDKAKYIFYSYQLALPTVFLVRHTAELAIKEAIERVSENPKKDTHDLIKLWNSLLSHFPKNKVPFDRKNINQINLFLDILSHLDSDGTKTRYSTDKEGEYTHGQFEWVNCILLSDTLDNFVKAIRSIDYEYVCISGKKSNTYQNSN